MEQETWMEQQPSSRAPNTKPAAVVRYGDFFRHHQRWTDQFYPYCEAPPVQKRVDTWSGADPELLDIIRQNRRSYA